MERFGKESREGEGDNVGGERSMIHSFPVHCAVAFAIDLDVVAFDVLFLDQRSFHFALLSSIREPELTDLVFRL